MMHDMMHNILFGPDRTATHKRIAVFMRVCAVANIITCLLLVFMLIRWAA